MEIYLFQNWQFGIMAENDEREEWCNLIEERSDNNGIYKHTDSQWGFQYMSFSKEELLKFAKDYVNKEYLKRKEDFNYIIQIKDQYDKL